MLYLRRGPLDATDLMPLLVRDSSVLSVGNADGDVVSCLRAGVAGTGRHEGAIPRPAQLRGGDVWV